MVSRFRQYRLVPEGVEPKICPSSRAFVWWFHWFHLKNTPPYVESKNTRRLPLGPRAFFSRV